ncbi:MAG: hypothetical protein IJ622_09445 [Bacteroidales bacterium]|nr:hypothetical protein [Bacteroidales bacterium]
MKKTFLWYLSLLLLCGCSNSQVRSSSHSEELEEIHKKGPKEIQPEGTFVANGNSLYKSLTFKGKKTVVVRDAIFGMDFPSEYEKDEEFLRVKTDKSDLLFEIISEDTIKGEGFAEGLYIKR